MPISENQHHHHFAFLASLSHILSAHSASPSPPSLPHLHHHSFHRNLACRLASLLPSQHSSFVALPFLCNALAALASTVSELEALFPRLSTAAPPSRVVNMIDYFLDHTSAAFLDACRVIRQVSVPEARKLHALILQSAASSADAAASGGAASLRRAKKALGDLRFLINTASEEAVPTGPLHAHRKWSSSQNLISQPTQNNPSQPLRHRSWNRYPNPNPNPSTLNPGRQLQTMIVELVPPKCDHGDDQCLEQQLLAAATYATNSIAAFFLGLIMVALPGSQVAPTALSHHHPYPEYFIWGSSLRLLEEKAHEEAKQRRKKSQGGILWELHQISDCIKELSDSIDSALSAAPSSSARIQGEEIDPLVKRLQEHGVKLGEGLDSLDKQVKEMFQWLIELRMKLLNSAACARDL